MYGPAPPGDPTLPVTLLCVAEVLMRYVFTFMCVLALSLMGCSETSGTGGSAGDGVSRVLFCEGTYCPACEEEVGPWGCLSQCAGGYTEPDRCDDARIEFKKCELVNDLCFTPASEHERDEESPCYWEAVDLLDCVNTDF